MVLRILPLGLHGPKEDSDHVFLNVENWFQYPDLKDYHGPPNVVHIVKFIEEIENLVISTSLPLAQSTFII